MSLSSQTSSLTPSQLQTVVATQQKLLHPLANIQTNEIDFKQESFHTWSNQRGYGNIVAGTSNHQGNIMGKVAPWNRLPAMKHPYDTLVQIDSAWSTNPNMCHQHQVESKK
jgi:hypothetical protein